MQSGSQASRHVSPNSLAGLVGEQPKVEDREQFVGAQLNIREVLLNVAMQTIIDGHVDVAFAVGIDQIKSVVLVQPPIKSKTLKPDTQLSGVLRPQLSRPYFL